MPIGYKLENLILNETRKSFQHLSLRIGTVYYVSKNGNDSNSGLSPEKARLTITSGISLLSPSDTLIVGTGLYIESVDFNVNSIQIIGEPGSFIIGTVTISGDSIFYSSLSVAPLAGNAFDITGDGNGIEDSAATAGVIGFNITGSRTVLRATVAVGYSAIGYNFTNFNNIVEDAIAQGSGLNTRGFYLCDAAVDDSLFNRCISNGNVIAGYELVPGCSNNVFLNCLSGSADGNKIDENDTNMWVNFESKLPQEQYEFLYPSVSGEGVASLPIVVDNNATDGAGGTRNDQDYWGDVKAIIPNGIITSEYDFIGLYIYAVIASDDQMWELLFTNGVQASQNGGNDWDENEVDLTIDDASLFLVDDWIWIKGDDRTDGEILKIANIVANVITIVRETTADGEAGLRYNYDISPGNNKIYLVHRPSSTLFHKIEGAFSASSAKDFFTFLLSNSRTISANGAVLMRMCNGTDAAVSSFEIRARYEI